MTASWLEKQGHGYTLFSGQLLWIHRWKLKRGILKKESRNLDLSYWLNLIREWRFPSKIHWSLSVHVPICIYITYKTASILCIVSGPCMTSLLQLHNIDKTHLNYVLGEIWQKVCNGWITCRILNNKNCGHVIASLWKQSHTVTPFSSDWWNSMSYWTRLWHTQPSHGLLL